MNHDDAGPKLTEAEITLLEGLGLGAELTPGWDPQAAGLRARHALFATALGITEVAEILGTNTKDIQHRIENSELLAIQEEGCWLLPSFQFYDGQCIEGFSLLATHIDPQKDLLWFYQWFTARSFDVDPQQQDNEISPKDWLVSGGAVEHLVRLYEMTTG